MADSNSVPKERIRIFDKEGFQIAEFRASVERSWAIGDEGRALFSYPSRKTDIVNEKVLQFGNYILIENDSLPAWVGVLDTPRDWSTRFVTVYAYSPEHIFGWRRGPLEQKLTGSAGTIFERMVLFLNSSGTTAIRVGDIYRGGTQREETLNPTQLNNNLKRIWERSGGDYQWRPQIDINGRLIIYADWLEQLGIETSALLHEGKGGGNVEAVGNILVEDGPIVNDLLAAGDGLSWTSRPAVDIVDAASQDKYGLRQLAKEYVGVSATNTLLSNGSELMKTNRNPSRLFKLNALNVGDTFKYINLGNRLTLRFENAGFYQGGRGLETQIRILGMSYDSANKNKMILIAKEVL